MVPSTTSDEEEEDHHRFDYEELATATGSFSPHNLIGRGSHGSVYKAFLNLPTNHVQIVAVKKPTSGLETQVGHDNSRKLENEIQTLSSLKGRRRHIVTTMSSPYIINFLGASHCNSNSLDKKKENGRLLLVTEFLPNGSLEDLLQSKKEVTHLNTTRHNIPWAQRVEIIVQLAKAVEFLHQGCVIHRDLKPSNILFDSSWTPKLADFGLAVSASHDDDDHQQPAAGTIGYMDPSYTSPSKLTTKVDVYSFGVVVLEVISGRKAMDVTRSPASVVDWAMGLIGKQRAMEICDRRSSSGLPPVFMEGTVEKLLYVAARCVSMSPDDRPSMAEIVAGLGGGGGPVRDQYRVRLPSWVDLVRRNLKRVRKKRKVVVKCDGQRDVSKGKLLLWELLADITLT